VDRIIYESELKFDAALDVDAKCLFSVCLIEVLISI